MFYLLAVLAFAEGLVRGRLLYVAGLIPVACFVLVALLACQRFKAVNGHLALPASVVTIGRCRTVKGGGRPSSASNPTHCYASCWRERPRRRPVPIRVATSLCTPGPATTEEHCAR